jgi:hypothetical protein
MKMQCYPQALLIFLLSSCGLNNNHIFPGRTACHLFSLVYLTEKVPGCIPKDFTENNLAHFFKNIEFLCTKKNVK